MTSSLERPGESGELLPVLPYLKAHPEGAMVHELAEAVGVRVGVVELYLRHLRCQRLVSCAFEGNGAILTWRATP